MCVGGLNSFVVLRLSLDDFEAVLHVKIDRARIVDLYEKEK